MAPNTKFKGMQLFDVEYFWPVQNFTKMFDISKTRMIEQLSGEEIMTIY